MSAVKVLITLVIAFVGINLLSTIYNSIKRNFREAFTDKTKSCPKGCNKSKDLEGNCSKRVYSNEDGTYHRKCNHRCAGPYDKEYDVDQKCDNNQECKGCGQFSITTDANGYKLQRNKNLNHPVESNSVTPYHTFGRKESREYSGSYTPPVNNATPVNGDAAASQNTSDNTDNTDNGDRSSPSSDSTNEWGSNTIPGDNTYVKSTNADDQNVSKKRSPLYDKSAHIHSYGTPQSYTNTRTTNMMSYKPKTPDLERKEGYAFEDHMAGQSVGDSIGLDSHYSELSMATSECHNTTMCGGINFDITSGQYTLMPVTAKLVPRQGFVAYIKTGGVAAKPVSSGAPAYGSTQGGAAGSGTGSGASWTIVANITPSYDTNNCHLNNTCPNGSLTSTSSSNATTTPQYNIIPSHNYHKNYSNDRTQGVLGYKFNSRESDDGRHRQRHHARRHRSDSDGAFIGRGDCKG